MMKENLKKILIEVPTIVVGVLIALAVNEWSIERERQALAEKVITAIGEELEYNVAAVRKALEYHVPMIDNMTKGKHRIFFVPMSRTNISVLNAENLKKFLIDINEEFGEALDPATIVKKKSDSLFVASVRDKMVTIKIENDTLKIFGKGNIRLRPAYIRNNSWKIAQAAQIAPYLNFKLIALMSELDKLHSAYEETISKIITMLYQGEGNVLPAMQDMQNFEEAMLRKYGELGLLLKGE